MIQQSISIVVILVLSLTNSGCATTKHDKATVNIKTLPFGATLEGQKSWWHIQFVKQWPEDTPPRFYYDPLIAEQIIKPVLLKYHNEIDLWRFHRRAGRDAAGSKFSFIFYTSVTNAKLISQEIKDNKMLRRMIDAGLIEQVWYDDYTTLPNPKIANTSDEAWPLEIQNSWPYYIMGVSQGWLALIGEITHDIPVDPDNATIEELVTHYENVSKSMDLIWLKMGGHAYIHHLSAIFAYEAVEVRF
ncbi:MAG: hypothetical protein EP297_13315 [Gammaproteobacteria bacterium]|nr:MAG: hypothetical protein EP297_13315 [Gammaproteobacteria bacterium]